MTDPIAKMRGEAVFVRVMATLDREASRIRSIEEGCVRIGLTPHDDRQKAARGLEAASAIILHLIATGQNLRLDGGKPPWIKTAADQEKWRTQVRTIRELLAELAGQARGALTKGEDNANAAVAQTGDGASQDSAQAD